MKKIIVIIVLLAVFLTPVYASNDFRIKTIMWLKSHNFSPEWIVVTISTLPIIELRGAIPVGMFMFKFSWMKAAMLSVAGNMIPIPFVLLFMNSFVALIRKSKTGVKFTDWLFKRTISKSKLIENYKAAGLAIFVGIPLPGTGAWTGAFAAEIFRLSFWKSLLYIFIGVLLAATAVTALCQMGIIALG